MAAEDSSGGRDPGAARDRIDQLRNEIDALDEQIVGMLNERARKALEIGTVKLELGDPIYAPAREAKVLLRVAEKNDGPLSSECLQAIYSDLMSCCRTLEERQRVSYLGPAASFTEAAARKHFGPSVEFLPTRTVGDVFREVAKGNANYGVVPIESSAAGCVAETLDMFIRYHLSIAAEVLLDVHHSLLSNEPMGKIERVYSKPEAFAQCRIWLEDNLPEAELIDVSSTAAAAEVAAHEEGAAAVANELAAEKYGLGVRARDIQDDQDNVTRFVVLTNTSSDPGPPSDVQQKTSVLFALRDEPGALCSSLTPFKEEKLNLSSIWIRPSRLKAWDYYFFIDVVGPQDREDVRRAIQCLKERCVYLEILGSFPAAAQNVA